jgi:hypothetical protein
MWLYDEVFQVYRQFEGGTAPNFRIKQVAKQKDDVSLQAERSSKILVNIYHTIWFHTKIASKYSL